MATVLQDFMLSLLVSIHMTKAHQEMDIISAYMLKEKGRIIYVAGVEPAGEDADIMLIPFFFQTDPKTDLSTDLSNEQITHLKELMEQDGIDQTTIDSFGQEIKMIEVKQIVTANKYHFTFFDKNRKETGYWSDLQSPLTVNTRSATLTTNDDEASGEMEKFRRINYEQFNRHPDDIVIPQNPDMGVIESTDFTAPQNTNQIVLVDCLKRFVALNAEKLGQQLTKARLDRMLAGFSLGIEKTQHVQTVSHIEPYSQHVIRDFAFCSLRNAGTFFTKGKPVVVDIRDPSSAPRSPLQHAPFEMQTESRTFIQANVDLPAETSNDVTYSIDDQKPFDNTNFAVDVFVDAETPYGQRLDMLKHVLRYSMRTYNRGLARHVMLGELLKKDYNSEQGESLHAFEYEDNSLKNELSTFVIISGKRATVLNVADTDRGLLRTQTRQMWIGRREWKQKGVEFVDVWNIEMEPTNSEVQEGEDEADNKDNEKDVNVPANSVSTDSQNEHEGEAFEFDDEMPDLVDDFFTSEDPFDEELMPHQTVVDPTADHFWRDGLGTTLRADADSSKFKGSITSSKEDFAVNSLPLGGGSVGKLIDLNTLHSADTLIKLESGRTAENLMMRLFKRGNQLTGILPVTSDVEAAAIFNGQLGKFAEIVRPLPGDPTISLVLHNADSQQHPRTVFAHKLQFEEKLAPSQRSISDRELQTNLNRALQRGRREVTNLRTIVNRLETDGSYIGKSCSKGPMSLRIRC